MDTRMIEVAIGLALVFALVSLLVTALQEFVASASSQRGRNLHKAIVSFVGDDERFASDLLRQPLIVSLAVGDRDARRLPSYMSSDIIVTSLISQLTTGGVRPASPGEWIAGVRSASAAGSSSEGKPKPEFVSSLASLAQGVENDWAAYEARLAAWYDAVGERSIGWYKRQTQWWLFGYGLAVAAAANINPIVIASSLWNDEPLRKAVVAAAEDASATYAQARAGASAGSSVAAALPASGSASAPPVPALLTSAAPRRVAQADAVETYLAQLKASLWALLERGGPTSESQNLQRALNDAIDLRSLLDKRRLPDDGSTARLRARVEADAEIDERLADLTRLLGSGTTQAVARQQLRSLEQAITGERKALSEPSVTRDSARCAKVEDASARDLCLRLNDLAGLQAVGLPIGWSPPALPRVVSPDCPSAAAKPTDCDNSWMFMNWVLLGVGWLVTALAATLGAPFWFDLLGKLIKLRGSGARPADTAATTSTGGSASATGTVGNGTLTRSAPGTTPPSAEAEPMSDALNSAEKALGVSEIERLQRAVELADAQVSGRFDAATRLAIIAWQKKQPGADASGELTAAQIQQLLGRQPAKDDDGYIG